MSSAWDWKNEHVNKDGPPWFAFFLGLSFICGFILVRIAFLASLIVGGVYLLRWMEVIQ